MHQCLHSRLLTTTTMMMLLSLCLTHQPLLLKQSPSLCFPPAVATLAKGHCPPQPRARRQLSAAHVVGGGTACQVEDARRCACLHPGLCAQARVLRVSVQRRCHPHAHHSAQSSHHYQQQRCCRHCCRCCCCWCWCWCCCCFAWPSLVAAHHPQCLRAAGRRCQAIGAHHTH